MNQNMSVWMHNQIYGVDGVNHIFYQLANQTNKD